MENIPTDQIPVEPQSNLIPEPQSEKKINKWLVPLLLLVILVLLVSTGILGYLYFQSQTNSALVSTKSDETQLEIPEQTPSAEIAASPAAEFSKTHYLSYVDPSQNLYVMDLDTYESSKIAEQSDPGNLRPSGLTTSSAYYYQECSQSTENPYEGQCTIKAYDYALKTTKPVYSEPIAFSLGSDNTTYYPQNSIDFYAFSNNREQMIFSFSQKLKALNLSSNQVTEVANLPQVVGRGGSLDDTARISWSPDNQHFLYISTVLDYNFMLFDSANQLAKIQPDTSHKTFPVWLDNQTILYKQLGFDQGVHQIVRFDINSGETTIVGTDQDWFNIQVSPDYKHLSYTLRPEGRLPETWIYSLEDSSQQLLSAATDFIDWMDDQTVLVRGISCDTQQQVPCDSIYGQATKNYQLVNLTGESEVLPLPDPSYSVTVSRSGN